MSERTRFSTLPANCGKSTTDILIDIIILIIGGNLFFKMSTRSCKSDHVKRSYDQIFNGVQNSAFLTEDKAVHCQCQRSAKGAPKECTGSALAVHCLSR